MTNGSRVRPAAVAGLAAGLAVGAVAGVAFAGPAIDPLISLAWGSVLFDGTRPVLSGPSLPVAHPLSILAAGVVGIPGPNAAYTGLAALAGISYLACAYSVYRLARALCGPGAGAAGIALAILAVVLLLTRPPIQYEALRAVIDVPYAALVIAALALVVESPRRAPWAPLALLCAAGLLRPDVWPLALLYGLWSLHLRRERGWNAIGVIALSLAGPLLWACFDLAISGHLLHTANDARAPTELDGSGYGFPPFSRPTDPSWLPGDQWLNDGVLEIPSMIAIPLALTTCAALLWSLLRRRDPALEGFRICAAAAAILALTLIAGDAAGAPLADRYWIALAILLLGVGTAALSLIPRGWPLALASLLLVVTVIVDQPRVLKRIHTQTADSVNLREQQRQVAELAAEPAVADAVARCPRVVTAGLDRQRAVMARALVALQLGRDVDEVELRRMAPRARASSFTYAPLSLRSYDLRHGPWGFDSSCLD